MIDINKIISNIFYGVSFKQKRNLLSNFRDLNSNKIDIDDLIIDKHNREGKVEGIYNDSRILVDFGKGIGRWILFGNECVKKS